MTKTGIIYGDLILLFIANQLCSEFKSMFSSEINRHVEKTFHWKVTKSCEMI